MMALHYILRLLLASVFLIAGTVKLFGLAEFTQSVGNFGLVPDWFVFQTAVSITVAELAIGIAVLLYLRWSLPAVLVLLGLFLGVLIYGIALGLDIHCGCFGPAIHVSLTQQVFMDAGLIVLTTAVYWSGVSCRTNRLTIRPLNRSSNV